MVDWRAGCVERRTSGSEGRIWETRPSQDGKERPVLTLHLLHFSTLIFYEIVFNLSTLLQAASRSYRLNQEKDECEVIYMFYENSMEHTAVQLMSRKQRAAKILTGDTGLTGLDALTEGEGGFEAALLDAITGEEALIDPRDLFKQDAVEDEITAEDQAFWNVDVAEPAVPICDLADVVPAAAETGVQPAGAPALANLVVRDDALADLLETLTADRPPDAQPDPVLQFATAELGAVVAAEGRSPRAIPVDFHSERQRQYVAQYLETVSLAAADRLRQALPHLLTLVREGEWDDREDVKAIGGILEACFRESEPMQKRLRTRVARWLRQKRIVTTEEAETAAQRVIALSQMAFDQIPLEVDIFEGMRIAQKEAASQQAQSQPRRTKKKSDRLAVPEDPSAAARPAAGVSAAADQPQQLALFS